MSLPKPCERYAPAVIPILLYKTMGLMAFFGGGILRDLLGIAFSYFLVLGGLILS